MTGTGRDATTCRNTPEQRRYQLLYQRARTRAVQDLIAAHKDEYEHLLQVHRAEVEAEAEQIDQAAAERADHDHGDEPPRLKSGRRAKGQKVTDRIDVARCPHCIRHHDRGHVCSNCGATPPVRPECGTEKGYQMHRYRKELACGPCLKGHAEEDKRRRAVREGQTEPQWVKGKNGIWRAS